MSRFSTTIAITREAHISSILQSFSTHFIIIFGKFRDSLDVVHIIYYSPTDIEYSRVTKNLRVLSECLSDEGINRVNREVSTIWEFVRLYSPVLDSNVLSGYLSLNTKTKTFIQILIYQFRHYPVSQSNPFTSNLSSSTSFTEARGSMSRSSTGSSSEYERSNGVDNIHFIMGITITLKGRIQTESIKPRKTVQSFIVGSHYSTLPVRQTCISMSRSGEVKGRHYLMSNTSRTTNSNYELGSYTISVRVTGITEW